MTLATPTAPTQPAIPADGYSPRLEITLEVAGRRFDVAETGRDFLVLRDPADVGPADATLHVAIDDDVTTRPIRLPQGICAGREEQPIER